MPRRPKMGRMQLRRKKVDIDLPSWPGIASETEEALTGFIGEYQASAPEERYATALTAAGISFQYKWTLGAPRGLPGWKELDFVVQFGGLLYADEVDTAFTHREKQNADVLHDAIVMNDQELKAMGLWWPFVTHIDGDYDLSSFSSARQYVRRRFGR